MPKRKAPRKGSLAFAPRKRAKRIYPRVKNWPCSEKIKMMGFSGYKVGMTHVIIMDTRKNSPTHGEEISIPVTIIECPPLKVLGIRFYQKSTTGLKVLTEVWDESVKKDGDLSRKVKIGNLKSKENFAKIEKEMDKIQDVRVIIKTQPRQSGLGKKKPEIFEIGIGGKDIKEKLNFSKEILGKEVKINNVFKEGEYVDTIAVTKGKGTQGVVKRFGVKIQVRKAKKHIRHIGTLGSERPGRVLWTVPMAGQMGFFTRTEFNKRIIKIGEDGKEITPKSGFINYGIIKGNYVLLEGSVPGSRKRLIILRHAIRPPKIPFLPTEIKQIKK